MVISIDVFPAHVTLPVILTSWMGEIPTPSRPEIVIAKSLTYILTDKEEKKPVKTWKCANEEELAVLTTISLDECNTIISVYTLYSHLG